MTTILTVLVTAIEIYSWALIIYILLSWFPGAKESAFGDFLARICEPYLEPFRRFIPPFGMIDISPLVAIIALKLARGGLVSLFNYFL
ncbi:YggT family protein [Bacillus hominis]|uniref:YggT family protein n=2 Tax=Bacillus cereus group TaxID=86661 RepID=A0A2B9E1J2_BACCE|nr:MULTISPECIES: YggT family protein [Bacillus cereus group]EJQ48595.1 hypothetical protein IEQ_03267 [Bacillus cereus BAG6X1-2]MBJ8051309.1 YggT family protein [Bacillus cereus]MDM5194911.1 YggT family protein [Bacillus hominis]MDM5434619.1 YggT family protein [Bacillus hominis]MDM5440069.1 YggT family protein [Bacillus hominis]